MPKEKRIEIKLRLSETEFLRLQNNVAKTKLSREGYLRHLVNGYIPAEAPPPDYFKMMNELYHVGNNLNQVARKAHVLNVIDIQRYDAAIESYNKIVNEINNTVIRPKEIE